MGARKRLIGTSILLMLAAGGSPVRAQDELPPGAGRELVMQKCNFCHAFATHAAPGYTPEGWTTVLRMMVNQGAPLTEADVAQLHAYLARNFPEKPRPAAVLVPGPRQVTMRIFPAATPGSRPHDPLAARDGSLWYTGQMANVLGRVDPATGKVTEYRLKTPHSGPHGIAQAPDGTLWYTGNTGALIGHLDPRSGDVTEYPIPDPQVRDPHTLLVDAHGIVWFTAQVANRIGRLDPASGQFRLVALPTPGARPYGMAMDPHGTIFVDEFGTNGIAALDTATMAVREYKLPDAQSRPRRIAITPDGHVWYTDFARGMLGRLTPATGEVKEWPSPSGPRSAPYGISVIGNVLWYSESRAKPNTVVRFDPASEQFQSWAIPGGGDIVRNTSVTQDGDLVLANSLVNTVTLVKVPRQ